MALIEVPNGSRAVLVDTASVNPALIPDLPGRYGVRLIVGDGCRASEPQVLLVSATPNASGGNRPPIADPGQPQLVGVGRSVTLSGARSSDPDGDLLSFAWVLVARPAGSTALLEAASSSAPHFVADRPGVFVAQLVVWDGQAVSLPSVVVITAESGLVNAAPLARAGADQAVSVGATVALDGSASTDLEGSPLTFRWVLSGRPGGSSAALDNPSAARPKFLADRAGTYLVSLVVNDGLVDSAPSNLTVTASGIANLPPSANAGPNRSVAAGTTVTLDGSASSDPNGDSLTYQWSLTGRPTGSLAALSSPTALKPTFVADLAGSFQVSLVVNDGKASSAASAMTVTALPTQNGTIAMLNHRVIDAEYSRALNRIITVSSGPNLLHVYDPVAKTDQSVALNLAPATVALSLDGQFAAVGHNGWVSYVQLSPLTLLKTLAVSCDVIDVVLPGNGYVHAFPRIDQWTQIRSLNLTTGVETMSAGWSIRAGTLAKLHPSGSVAYGANNGLSPSDIEKYNLDGGTAVRLYDSPYHGDYPMCGNLWITDTGDRIFTRCGNVFRSSPIQSMDMLYAGSLSGLPLVRHLDHSSAAGKLIAIPENGYGSTTPAADVKVRKYEDAFLVFQSEATLPQFTVGSASYATHGRFAFFNSAGTGHFVLVQVDPTSGAQLDWGVVSY
ncbi:MAG: chitinase [Myxococcaceae bacterium]|nr:chitinase [Myxococcaceae bacterium]